MARLKIIFSLGFRNLIRQKRRNILLGTALAFGTMILITANSFSAGLTDILLNKLVVQITGHIEVVVIEKSRAQNAVMRSKKFFTEAINQNLKGIKEISENTAVFSRVLGNNKGENMIIVPVHLQKTSEQDPADLEYLKGRQSEGNASDLLSTQFENPVAIYKEKANSLRAKLHDTLRVRLKTVSGQEQSARFTVVAILKSESLFDSGVLFIPLETLKKLRGFRTDETGTLQVNFHEVSDTANIIRQADKLQAYFKPQLAAIQHKIICGKAQAVEARSMGLLQNHQENKASAKLLTMVSGSVPLYKDTDSIIISEKLHKNSKCKIKDIAQLIHLSVHEKEPVMNTLRVAGIFQPKKNMPADILFSEAGFYRAYLNDLPVQKTLEAKLNAETLNLFSQVFAPEYRVLPRSRTSEDMLKKMQDLRKTGYFGPTIDVRTMYESASQVLELEKTLFIITFIAGLVLFFIIIIGVINTLRMTIRERTREIGTMRALGMQQNDIRNIFLSETALLTFFASVAGILFSILVIFVLSRVTIETDSVLGMFLHKKHLYFLIKSSSVFANLLTIMAISLATAYFPSRRAAKMPAADALRHYE